VIAISGNRIVRRNLLRAAIGIAAADAMTFGGMRQANADAPLMIYTREDWGAMPPRRPPKVFDRPPDHIIVHHTTSPNTPDRSRAHAFALSRQIQRFHMLSRGWDDIGEQLTISRGGVVMEGRAGSLQAVQENRLVVGAQSYEHNEHTFGIENEGFYTTEELPDALWNSLVRVCAWLCTAHALDPSVAIVGHCDYNQTSCPGDALYRRLPELRNAVQRILDISATRLSSTGHRHSPQDSGVE
jgi:hypothetical protein